MPEQQKPKPDKKLSLAPLSFEEAVKGLLETEPPKETQEKKTVSKRRGRKTDKKTEQK